MAKTKRKPYSMRTKLSVEERQRIIEQYRQFTGTDEVCMKDAARWAYAQGLIPEHAPYDPIKAFASELSEAAREEYYTDPQGREVRKNHVFFVTDPDGQKRFVWIDHRTAKPEPMHKSLQGRRRQAFGDVVQLDTDRLSYNENNLFGAQIEMSYNFDDDLAEMRMPTSYPDASEFVDGADEDASADPKKSR